MVLVAAAAGIAFAAEVSAGVRIDVDAFNYQKADGTMTMLTLKHHNEDYESPISFSVSGEKAGATYHICEAGGTDINSTKWNIWFQPIDMLKVNIGTWDTNLNKETIDWNSYSDIGSAGVTLTLAPIDGFTFDATFAPGWGSWFQNDRKVATSKVKDYFLEVTLEEAAIVKGSALTDAEKKEVTEAFEGTWKTAWDNASADDRNDLIDLYLDNNDTKAAVAELGFMAHYTADGIGTISAMFDAKNSFDNLAFGAGYKNTFGPATVFVNALGFTNDKKFAKVRVEGYVEVPADALTVKAFVAGGYNMEAYDPRNPWDFAYFAGDDKAFFGAKAKIAYSLGDVTPYLYVKDENFLADDFKAVIKPGLEVNIDGCSIDAALEVTAAKEFGISVPVKFTFNF